MNTQPLINQKILGVMSEVTAIVKKQKNENGGFLFRGIDDIQNTLHPLFQKHGIFITTEVLHHASYAGETTFKKITRTEIDVIFKFHAIDGSFVTSKISSEATDNEDKGMSKALSIALRTALTQMFLIPTEQITVPHSEQVKEDTYCYPTNPNKDNRSWLTPEQFKKALARIKGGDKELYEKINKKFRMKNEYRKEFENEIKQTSTTSA